MRKGIAIFLSLALGVLGATVVGRNLVAHAETVVGFYRVRLEYSTTSDHSTLEVADPAAVLTMRPISQTGNLLWAQRDVDRLSLNQDLGAALAGQSVGVVVDYALVPSVQQTGLALRVQQGSINAAVLRASVVGIDGSTRALTEVSLSAEARNLGEVTLDLSGLTEGDRLDGAVPDEPPKTLWALYYGWYGEDSWSRPSLKDSPLAPYASNDPAHVDSQVAQAAGAGIDAFLASWWGPGHYTDETFPLVLDAVAAHGMTASIYLEVLPDGVTPLGEEQLYSWLAYALGTYASHPAYGRFEGVPVVGLWAADKIDRAVWARVFDRLRAEGLDAVYLAGGSDLAQLEVFDAGYDYLPQEGGLDVRSEPAFIEAVRNYPLLADSSRPKASVMTLNPGYDDTLVPGRLGTVLERQDGERYQRHIDAALAADPDWVLITSWNEWYENTHIEPSTSHGTRYLELTAAFADAWKAGEGDTPTTTTAPPTTPPPTTGPPTTEPPSTTLPPTTAPPTTEPPTTSPPATEPPAAVPATTTTPPTTAPTPTPPTSVVPVPAPAALVPTTSTPPTTSPVAIQGPPPVTTTTTTTTEPLELARSARGAARLERGHSQLMPFILQWLCRTGLARFLDLPCDPAAPVGRL